MRTALNLLILALIASLPACTSFNNLYNGSAMMETARPLPPTSPQIVTLYYDAQKPVDYKVIGFVGAENNNLIGYARSPEAIQAELRKQAASLGATGVINITTGLIETTGDAIISQ